MEIGDKSEQLTRLLRDGKTRGFVLYDEIDALLPPGYEGGAELDAILSAFARNSIEILEEPKPQLHDESFEENELREMGEADGDPVRVYLREVLTLSHLTSEQEIELAKRIGGGGQDAEHAERQLIEANLRLVAATAKRYRNRGRSLLDLLQEGNIGLMKAVKNFDHTRGYKFSTYAIWWVRRTLMQPTTEE